MVGEKCASVGAGPEAVVLPGRMECAVVETEVCDVIVTCTISSEEDLPGGYLGLEVWSQRIDGGR